MDADAMRECAQHCNDCHVTCVETSRHCMEQGGDHVRPAHFALLLTCADICATSARALLRGVHEHVHTCRACAALCRACAESCAAMADDDPAMRRCADACNACADSCERMAA